LTRFVLALDLVKGSALRAELGVQRFYAQAQSIRAPPQNCGRLVVTLFLERVRGELQPMNQAAEGIPPGPVELDLALGN
jgi:hypothetical protein